MEPRRRYAFARLGDTVTDVARRHLPGDPQAPEQIASWNVHLSLRRDPIGDGRLLPTDIVYLEPPLP